MPLPAQTTTKSRFTLDYTFHAAHQLADAVLANQRALNFRVTYGPKVHGARALQRLLASLPHICDQATGAGSMGAG